MISYEMEVNWLRTLMRKREVKNDRILLVLRTRKEQRSGPHDAWIPAFAGMTDGEVDSRLRGNDGQRRKTRAFAGMTETRWIPAYAGMTKALYCK
ncbi:hypothetical protein SMC1_07855 [Candidatus Cryosericum septentrionale]|jgi:hypothetical protein|uniref:Uncharacterized protein n=1 Tax=Candidatus Cryosericum septentrionale TaxID=2290913 RepID=A0A398DYA2_9BACT|nr:hypothetical protein SMC1_07855 [Candidatus Cryosericum septentrionale]